MKWARYQTENGPAYGIIEGDTLVEVSGSPFTEWATISTKRSLESVKLLVPVLPQVFYAGGLNYERHVIESCRKYGIDPELPSEVHINYRSNNALVAHEEDIVMPRDASALQYEAELVVVIGKRAKNVSRDDALEYVLGWTIGNDVTERSWQLVDQTIYRSKNADTFKPMGPWIETDIDLQTMKTTVRLNDLVVETFDTRDMLFDAAAHIAEISKYCTLHPGDVIWLGTDGVPEDMKVGDQVEIELSGIGILRNKIVAEA